MDKDIIVPIVIFYFIYRIFSLFARRKERRMMIEKLSSITCENDSALARELLDIHSGSSSNRKSMLSTPLLLMGLALGTVIGYFLIPIMVELNQGYCSQYTVASTILLASALFFGGVGMIVAYFIERKEK